MIELCGEKQSCVPACCQLLQDSRSAKPSGCSAYGMLPCRTNHRSGYAEQFAEMHASGLDPVWDQGVTQVKGRNGPVNLNVAYRNQYVTLSIWGG
eukprot:266467-Ditylum_brightwellii.AAC.1